MFLSAASFGAAVEKIDPADDYCTAYLDIFDVEESEDGRGYFVNAAAYAESASAATLTVSGLPSGLKFNAQTGDILGTATRAGVYFITVTAKNANKYQHVATARLEIPDIKTGEVPTGEKDEIADAGWFDFGFLDGMVTGMETGIMAEWPSSWGLTLKGLPAGMTVVKKAWFDGSEYYDVISGMPTKAGAFTVTATMKDPENARVTLTTICKIIVADAGSFYVAAIAEDGGTVTGGGIVAGGAKFTGKAVAASGYVFAGWFFDEYGDYPCEWIPEGSDAYVDYRSPSYTWQANDRLPDVIYGRFIPKTDDEIVVLAARSSSYADYSNSWWLDNDEELTIDRSIDAMFCGGYEYLYVKGASGSQATVTVTGLPKGINFSPVSEGWYELYPCYETAPKTGEYAVKVTVKNQSGRTETRSVRLVVWDSSEDNW